MSDENEKEFTAGDEGIEIEEDAIIVTEKDSGEDDDSFNNIDDDGDDDSGGGIEESKVELESSGSVSEAFHKEDREDLIDSASTSGDEDAQSSSISVADTSNLTSLAKGNCGDDDDGDAETGTGTCTAQDNGEEESGPPEEKDSTEDEVILIPSDVDDPLLVPDDDEEKIQEVADEGSDNDGSIDDGDFLLVPDDDDEHDGTTGIGNIVRPSNGLSEGIEDPAIAFSGDPAAAFQLTAGQRFRVACDRFAHGPTGPLFLLLCILVLASSLTWARGKKTIRAWRDLVVHKSASSPLGGTATGGFPRRKHYKTSKQ